MLDSVAGGRNLPSGQSCPCPPMVPRHCSRRQVAMGAVELHHYLFCRWLTVGGPAWVRGISPRGDDQGGAEPEA